jgi:prevent-host-death family protein
MPGTDRERKDDVSYTDGLVRISMLEIRDKMGEVVDAAMTGEPRVITRYGRDSVVVIGLKDYERFRALEASAA